jgi:hypothetical protein
MQRPILILLAIFVSLLATAPAGADDTHPAANAVIAFNQAITDRQVDAATAWIANGAVQFHLHPAHPGMSEDHPLTEDMDTMWTTVAAILFPTTDSYARSVEIVDVRADGELATVWTDSKTTTYRKGKTEPMVLEFSEIYLMVNKNATGWKIAGNASNRPIDEIAVN